MSSIQLMLSLRVGRAALESLILVTIATIKSYFLERRA
jgi:hypothetical protein